jgi:hypothetical protein
MSYRCRLFGTNCQWRTQLFQLPFIKYIQLLATARWTHFESVNNSAMNILSPACCYSLWAMAMWIFRAIGTAQKMPSCPLLRPVQLHLAFLSRRRDEFHSSVGNSGTNCTAVLGGAESLKGSQRLGDGRISLKTSAHLSLVKVFRMYLISAGSNSLGNTFKNSINKLNILYDG